MKSYEWQKATVDELVDAVLTAARSNKSVKNVKKIKRQLGFYRDTEPVTNMNRLSMTPINEKQFDYDSASAIINLPTLTKESIAAVFSPTDGVRGIGGADSYPRPDIHTCRVYDLDRLVLSINDYYEKTKHSDEGGPTGVRVLCDCPSGTCKSYSLSRSGPPGHIGVPGGMGQPSQGELEFLKVLSEIENEHYNRKLALYSRYCKVNKV